jgi:hypothetical protein
MGRSLLISTRHYTWASSRAGPGRARPRQSPKQKMSTQARPSPTVGPKNVCLGPARVSCFLSCRRAFGLGLPKIVQICYPGLARVSSQAVFLLPRPAHRAKKYSPSPRFSGRACRDGLPMPRLARHCEQGEESASLFVQCGSSECKGIQKT